MSKLLNIIVLVCVCVLFTSFVQEDEKIIWSKDRLLTWEDFKGKPQIKSTAGAISDVGIAYSYEYKSEHLKFTIYSVFYPLRSWVIDEDKIVSTLEHEQLHFNIVEIHSRRLRKELSEAKFRHKDIKERYTKLCRIHVANKNKCQELYDKETTNPRNEKVQKEWKVKIANELKELEAYSNPVVEVKVKR